MLPAPNPSPGEAGRDLGGEPIDFSLQECIRNQRNAERLHHVAVAHCDGLLNLFVEGCGRVGFRGLFGGLGTCGFLVRRDTL
jgi:hypothetical protein